MSQLTRRDFLRASAMTAVGVVAASCAQPTPQVIEKPVTVVVEKEVQVEKEVLSTVIVEKEVAVEKVVQQTVIVETEKVVKETVVVEREKQVDKVVTATPVIMKYNEAPMWAGKVQSGELPPVDERLPEDPVIVPVAEEIGQYGGTWHRLAVSNTDIRTPDRLMSDCLVHWDKDGTEIYSNVLSGYESAPDGTEFTFRFRKGMRWSDGAPYSADDIMWYFVDHLGNEEINPAGYPGWLRPGDVPVKAEKIDEYTMRLSFASSAGILMLLLASNAGYSVTNYPAHYAKQFHPDYTDKAVIEKAAKDAGFEFWYQLYGDRTGGNAPKNYPEFPVIHAWKVIVPPPKQPVVLERNPYYYKVDPEGNQLPYIDRVEHMIVQGTEQVNLRALQGEVDMQLRHMTFDNFPIFMENREKGDYRILQWPRGYETDCMIIPHCWHLDEAKAAILTDKRFRYALSLGIKRQEIIDAIYYGVTYPNQISPLPTSPFYDEAQAKNMIEYDPDRANGYLDEMGLTGRDAEGYRLRPDGKRLSFFFEYSNTFGAWGPIGELLSSHWKEIGIELIVKEMDRILFDERVPTGDMDISMWTTSGEFYPILDVTSPFINWDNAQPYQDWYLSGGSLGLEPPEWMQEQYRYFDAARASVALEDQVANFKKLLAIFKDQMTHIGICSAPPEVVVVKNNFRNVPETAVSDWPLLTPGNTNPEQYFVRQ